MTDSSLNYIPLHLHSDYSIMDGLENVATIVKRAAKLKFPALALTDMSNISGFIRFYNACRAAGIKPIMGADLDILEPPRPGEKEHTFRVTLLAMNNEGKQNLYDLLSIAWQQHSDAGSFNAKATLEELGRYSRGLILLSGFRADLAAMMAAGNESVLQNRLNFYLEHFGDRFCFEITRTGREGEDSFEAKALDLCLQYGIAPVASCDAVFLYGEEDTGADGLSDYEIHDIRVSIQHGCQRGNKQLARIYSKEQYLHSAEQMRALFADLPEALSNTRAIAARCNITIELDHPRLPHYDTGDLSPAEYLRREAYKGLEERLKFLYPDEAEREKQRPRYEKRLETELNVIITMDFPGYFLIVMEFIQWSKDHGVPVGPGRGSGGGSLVAYSIKITDFDPLRFDLLFERFLNPERVSMPDFDVDFCQRKRELTLEHVKDRYEHNGITAVSQIAAFGTMAPKAAIKDAGRALGMGYGAVDYVAKMLPAAPGLTFKSALGIGKKGESIDPAAPDFKKLYEQAKASDDKARVELIEIAMRLEGVIRNIGKHAAGVVISPTRTAEFAPLMLDADGNPITQFDKKDVEHAGLVKFDFLGLTTLTIIDDALHMINAKNKRLKRPLVDIHAVPYEDPESFKVLQRCETTAVFQLESAGMRKLIGQMQPDRFDDLIALVALFRPGPLNSGMVDHFVKRKHGEEKVCYPQEEFQDLDLKPILDSTYGVIVYQEQVMQIAQVLAGYSLGGADILRRAMGKKNPVEMANQRGVFLEGAKKKGKDPDIAMKIFDQVEKFAEYGFNKSHSAAYALVAWWTLWLKVHYPAEFLAAMMTADRQKTEKLVSYIAECTHLGIKINPPDVTVGGFDFSVDEQGAVIYGIGAVKGIGEDLIAAIVKEREKGPFLDFFDFVSRVGAQRLNRRSLEALIVSGALDKFCSNRAALMKNIPTALKYASKQSSDNSSGQQDLFAVMSDQAARPQLELCQPWSEKVRLAMEQAVLGLYLSGHPINSYKAELRQHCALPLSDIKPGTPDHPNPVEICGAVISLNDRTSKNDGSRYYILTLDDSTSQLEVSLYREHAQKMSEILAARDKNKNARARKTDPSQIQSPLILILHGMLSMNNDGQLRLRVRALYTLEELRRLKATAITLTLTEREYEDHAPLIYDLLTKYAVPATQGLMLSEGGQSIRRPGCILRLKIGNSLLHLANKRWHFDPGDDLIDGLRDAAGSAAVAVSY